MVSIRRIYGGGKESIDFGCLGFVPSFQVLERGGDHFLFEDWVGVGPLYLRFLKLFGGL